MEILPSTMRKKNDNNWPQLSPAIRARRIQSHEVLSIAWGDERLLAASCKRHLAVKNLAAAEDVELLPRRAALNWDGSERNQYMTGRFPNVQAQQHVAGDECPDFPRGSGGTFDNRHSAMVL